MDINVETKSRNLDLDGQDLLFETVEIFSTDKTYFLLVPRSTVSI
jgi:hypothetical protein